MTTENKKPCLAERFRAEILKACPSPEDFREPADGRLSRFITGARAVFENMGTPLPFLEQKGLDGVYQLPDDSVAAVYADHIDVTADPNQLWRLPDQKFVAILDKENPQAVDALLNLSTSAPQPQAPGPRPADEFVPPANLKEAQELLKALEDEDFPVAIRYANEFGITLDDARAEIRKSADLIVDVHNEVWRRGRSKPKEQPDAELDQGPAPSGT